MTQKEVQVNLSRIFMDRLGPDVFSTFYMKGEVLHRVRAFKGSRFTICLECNSEQEVAYVFISLNEITRGYEKIERVSGSFLSNLTF